MAESSTSQYKKILQAHGANTWEYWLVVVIENDCIVTWVGVYDEILPELSGNPSGSGNISSNTPTQVTIQLQYTFSGLVGTSSCVTFENKYSLTLFCKQYKQDLCYTISRLVEIGVLLYDANLLKMITTWIKLMANLTLRRFSMMKKSNLYCKYKDISNWSGPNRWSIRSQISKCRFDKDLMEVL